MEDDHFISKTRRKKQMHELQALGRALVDLPEEQLARLGLPEGLLEAVLDCKRITRHEARRRQVQYIGRIMRDVDAGPIAERLAALRAPTRRQAALFHVAERWRDTLVEDPAGVDRFVAEFPQADPQRLRELAQAAREERQGDRPPRQFRELFHVVSAIVQHRAGKP